VQSAEILIDKPINARGVKMLRAMHATAPEDSVVSESYTGKHHILVLYGAGLPQRQNAIRVHRAAGGRVVTLDMGYWGRTEEDMRIAVDVLHPTHSQIEMTPPVARREIVLREDADPNGPIMLIGMGSKTSAMYGFNHLDWERNKAQELRHRFPRREIVWRPKGRVPTRLMGLPLRHGMEIEDALVGCSLVVMRHSNVSVNACIAGVPVECEGGAAHALYVKSTTPTREQRLDFLSRLSWWNYTPDEAAVAWQHLGRFM